MATIMHKKKFSLCLYGNDLDHDRLYTSLVKGRSNVLASGQKPRNLEILNLALDKYCESLCEPKTSREQKPIQNTIKQHQASEDLIMSDLSALQNLNIHRVENMCPLASHA